MRIMWRKIVGKMTRKKSDGSKRLPASFVTGAIALAFLITGYQTALFVHRAAVMKVMADMTSPDTVILDSGPSGASAGTGSEPYRGLRGAEKGASAHGSYAHAGEGLGEVRGHTGAAASRSESSGTVRSGMYVETRPGRRPVAAEKVAAKFTRRTCESFPFDPNTAGVGDLCRLGFSVKQAEAIDNYRKKGGRFRRKSDFAKSFVVADSVYRRLEPYIDIPLLDLNSADSAAFDALPGIGGYFASRMVSYRKRLGGYSFPEQLMDIYHFDREKFAEISDLVTVGTEPRQFGLWTLPPDSLRLHPYIGNWKTARAVVLYRENNPRTELTVSGLVRAGIIDEQTGEKLSRCRISVP